MDETEARQKIREYESNTMMLEFLFKQGFAVRVDGKVFEVVKSIDHLKEIMYDEAMRVN